MRDVLEETTIADMVGKGKRRGKAGSKKEAKKS
jgi:hypothetical protein